MHRSIAWFVNRTRLEKDLLFCSLFWLIFAALSWWAFVEIRQSYGRLEVYLQQMHGMLQQERAETDKLLQQNRETTKILQDCTKLCDEAIKEVGIRQSTTNALARYAYEKEEELKALKKKYDTKD